METPRSGEQCTHCGCYLEIVLYDATKILTICPVCLNSVAIVRLSPTGERVREPQW